jgi:hypothetical protein
MDDPNARTIKRLNRLRWVLTGATIVLAISIVLLLILDFA